MQQPNIKSPCRRSTVHFDFWQAVVYLCVVIDQYLSTFYMCISHILRLNGDESCLIIPSPSLSSLLGHHPFLLLPALCLTSLLPFPLLVTTWMCHCFYHFRGSCLLEHKPPAHSQWMAPLMPSTARPVGHMTVITTPPHCGRKAPGCINEDAKGEEEPEVGQRWRWSSLGLTGCLQLLGFFCGPLVALLHLWSATSTSEVRPHSLKCHGTHVLFKNGKNYNSDFILLRMSTCSRKNAFINIWIVVPAPCVFEGTHYSLGETWMDKACMQCTCLHPVGVGCCETWVHKQPMWFGFQMPIHGFSTAASFRETEQSSTICFTLINVNRLVFMCYLEEAKQQFKYGLLQVLESKF